MGPSLSIVGSRSIVGVRVRKTLLASSMKVTGLAIDVSISGMHIQYAWSARSSAEVTPEVVSTLE